MPTGQWRTGSTVMPPALIRPYQIPAFTPFISIRISTHSWAAWNLNINLTLGRFDPWSASGTEADWKITLPPNTKGFLPISSEMVSRWILDDHPIGRSSKLKAIGKRGAEEVFEVPAGTYNFKVKLVQP